MQKLLDELEQAGYRDADGALLTNDRNWHVLRGLVARRHAFDDMRAVMANAHFDEQAGMFVSEDNAVKHILATSHQGIIPETPGNERRYAPYGKPNDYEPSSGFRVDEKS